MQTIDLPIRFNATASARYSTSGIQITDIQEIQLLGCTSDSTAQEIWIEFKAGKRMDLRSRVVTESADQHLTGKWPLPGPSTSNLSGVFLPVPLRLAYSRLGQLEFPPSLTINFSTSAGAALSHSGVLYLRCITRRPQ
jgi:hypothetical protein